MSPQETRADAALNAVEQVWLDGPDEHAIPVYIWRPEGEPEGIVHICHGMAEHAQRYAPLAGRLSRYRLLVVAHDHRGHGPHTPEESLGHYANENGWDKVAGDVGVVQHWVHGTWPTLPCYLLGHSMGSFIVQSYLMRGPAGSLPAGLILSGSNRDRRVRLGLLRTLLKIVRRVQGANTRSSVIRKLTFGAFSKSVKSPRTEFDWLSHDPATVDDYINDPYCGFDCTNQLWSDFGSGLASLRRRNALQRIPANLPILIVSGADDPVGEFGRGTQRLAQAYRQSGHRDVTCIVFQGMRHEPFNERRREEAEQALLDWIDRH
ncbi:alpha/beta fold hydrolase [Marinobacter fonticola]|uniref:alpha/beta fold hydrolase n=1 Tax=Marinobacter fonticola TaxID=2603215 RepID=UPI0011E7CAD3|nr:alpha/beta fold hydrolase [Marinobacter fonticola]